MTFFYIKGMRCCLMLTGKHFHHKGMSATLSRGTFTIHEDCRTNTSKYRLDKRKCPCNGDIRSLKLMWSGRTATFGWTTQPDLQTLYQLLQHIGRKLRFGLEKVVTSPVLRFFSSTSRWYGDIDVYVTRVA